MSTTINEPTVPTVLDSPRVAGLGLAVQMPFIAVNVNGNPQTNATEFTQGVLQGNGFLIFNTEDDQYALRALQANPPTTVAALWWEVLNLTHKLARTKASQQNLIKGLEKFNEHANQVANDNSMCEEYEATLKEANRLMEECGYTGFFRWEGRTEDYEVEVMRLRTVQEKITVTVPMPKGSDEDDVIREAYELAEAETDDSWDENDREWGTEMQSGSIQ